VRLNLVYYGRHEPEIDARIVAAAPDYAIVNTPHGLWGEVQGCETPLCLPNPAGYHAAGIKVMGYLTGGYEGTGSGGRLEPEFYSLDFNRRIIEVMSAGTALTEYSSTNAAAIPIPRRGNTCSISPVSPMSWD